MWGVGAGFDRELVGCVALEDLEDMGKICQEGGFGTQARCQSRRKRRCAECQAEFEMYAAENGERLLR